MNGKRFVLFYKRNLKIALTYNLKSIIITNDMLVAMFPNLNKKIAKIALTIPVSTTSVERSFSQMKLIKTRLRNSLNEGSFSHLMKIAIESPEKLSDRNKLGRSFLTKLEDKGKLVLSSFSSISFVHMTSMLKEIEGLHCTVA